MVRYAKSIMKTCVPISVRTVSAITTMTLWLKSRNTATISPAQNLMAGDYRISDIVPLPTPDNTLKRKKGKTAQLSHPCQNQHYKHLKMKFRLYIKEAVKNFTPARQYREAKHRRHGRQQHGRADRAVYAILLPNFNPLGNLHRARAGHRVAQEFEKINNAQSQQINAVGVIPDTVDDKRGKEQRKNYVNKLPPQARS